MADSLFSPKDFNNADLKAATGDDYAAKVKIIENWQAAIANGKVLSQKEEQLQANFLERFFGDVLGYPYEKHLPEYMLENEPKTIADSTKPDGALGYFKLADGEMEQDVRVVIELKGATVNLDKKQNRADFKGTPVEQAFGYVPKMGGNCKWVIVSNFLEIRLYHHFDITRYQSFVILDLLKNGNLPKFLFLLQFGQLFLKTSSSPIDVIFEGRQALQKTISNKFYGQYKDIRQHLFYDIRKHNPKIEPVTLFHCTQKLIDRIIFICFVKDMQIIKDVLKQVKESAQDSYSQSDDKIWKELKYLFMALDKGYARQNIPPFNGGLFMRDNILDTLDIRDNKLEDLVDFALSYDFQSELNVNILGHIFEQSISDIEEIIASIQAETPLEAAEAGLEKVTAPTTSKRKKDGIFYTPAYITRYIVEQSIGAWLEDRSNEILKSLGQESLTDPTPADYQSIQIDKKGRQTYNDTIKWHLEYWHQYEKQLRGIKVLDPACGSGAFLTQTLDYLFEEWSVLKRETEKLTTPWDTVLKNNLREKANIGLAMETKTWNEWQTKKQIIVENIFGVDINPASVEITRLSLWLKTANRTESLANLEENIRLGNSLIDDPEVAGDLAFDWNKEFKSIMSEGGFDVMVGNPPYVRQELLGFIKNHLSKYKVFNSSSDLFAYFYEKAVTSLKKNGYLGYISNTFERTTSGVDLRRFLKNSLRFINYVDFTGIQIFEDATTYPIIIIAKKELESAITHSFLYTKIPNDTNKLGLDISSFGAEMISQESLSDESWSFNSKLGNSVLQKLKKHGNLKEKYGKSYYGIKTGYNEAFIVNSNNRDKILKLSPGDAEIIKPFYEGKDIDKWVSPATDKYIIFTKRGTDIEKYKGIKFWLKVYKKKLEPKTTEDQIEGRKPGKYKWFEIQDSVDYYKYFENPKITWPNLQNSSKFCFEDKGYYINAPSVILPTDSKALLAILNSKAVWYFLKSICAVRNGGYIEVKPQYFEQIPIPDINKKRQNSLTQKANLMLSGNKDLHELSEQFLELLQADFKLEKPSNKLNQWYDLDWDSFKTEIKKAKPNISLSGKTEENWNERFNRKKAEAQKIIQSLAETDKEIDGMVYELYGLSEEEIKIVEG